MIITITIIITIIIIISMEIASLRADRASRHSSGARLEVYHNEQ